MIHLSISEIELISIEVAKESNISFSRKRKWKILSEQKIWYELVGCILGSRVPYDHAVSALNQLVDEKLLDPIKISRSPKTYEKKISTELSKPIYKPYKSDNTGRKFRYPNIRAENICKCAKTIYSNEQTIKMLLENDSIFYVRNWLSNNCSGIGMKQASLFLRNIGYCDQMAIIDSHIIKFMKEKEMIQPNIKMNTKTQYSNIENTFIQYARDIKMNPGVLDLAIWAVMSQVEVKGAS